MTISILSRLIEKWSHLPKGAKASIAYFIASLVSAGMAYLTTPLFTRLLTPDEYGSTALFITWQRVFGIVAMFSLSSSVFNVGMSDYEDKRDEFSFSLLVLSNVITILSAGVLFVLYPFISGSIGLDKPMLILIFVGFLVNPAYNFWLTRQRYEYKYKGALLWTIISVILSPLVALICILNQQPGERLYARVFGSQIPLILIQIGFYYYIAKKGNFKVNFNFCKFAFLFNLPLIPHYLSGYLLDSCDKIMISNMVSTSATAFYSVAYSIAGLASIGVSAINSSLIPYTYEKCKTKDYAAVNKITIPILFVFAALCLLVILFAPEIVRIMATDEYMEAIYVIPPVVAGCFFHFQYFIFANILFYYKKPVLVMYGSVISVVVNIALNYLLIPQFGYQAAGYTTLICFIIQAIFDYIVMKKAIGTSVYNMKLISLMSFVLIIASLLCLLVYHNVFLRYLFVLLLISVFVFTRKKIFGLFAIMKRK